MRRMDRISEDRRKAAELAANPIPMPEGEFDVVLAAW